MVIQVIENIATYSVQLLLSIRSEAFPEQVDTLVQLSSAARGIWGQIFTCELSTKEALRRSCL